MGTPRKQLFSEPPPSPAPHTPQTPSREGLCSRAFAHAAPSSGASPFPAHPANSCLRAFPTLRLSISSSRQPPGTHPPLFQTHLWHAPATTPPAARLHVCLPLGQSAQRVRLGRVGPAHEAAFMMNFQHLDEEAWSLPTQACASRAAGSPNGRSQCAPCLSRACGTVHPGGAHIWTQLKGKALLCIRAHHLRPQVLSSSFPHLV